MDKLVAKVSCYWTSNWCLLIENTRISQIPVVYKLPSLQWCEASYCCFWPSCALETGHHLSPLQHSVFEYSVKIYPPPAHEAHNITKPCAPSPTLNKLRDAMFLGDLALVLRLKPTFSEHHSMFTPAFGQNILLPGLLSTIQCRFIVTHCTSMQRLTPLRLAGDRLSQLMLEAAGSATLRVRCSWKRGKLCNSITERFHSLLQK